MMSAFVPAAGFSLKSSTNSFVTGCTSVCEKNGLTVNSLSTSSSSKSTINMNSESPQGSVTESKFSSLSKKPSLNINTEMFSKSKAQAAENASTMKSTRPPYKLPNATSQLPKFYNPSTGLYEFNANAKGQNSSAFDSRILSTGTMINPSDNRRVNSNDTFRNMDLYTDDLLWARPGWSPEESSTGINVIIRQVFGNANLFESEMSELDYSVSCVRQTANVKEFIRALGLSYAYRTRFFDNMSNLRFIELNFLHFFGRAPRTQEEVSEHIQIITEKGYNAEINSYIDSDEYDTLYGESRVPSSNFKGGYITNSDMNKLAILNGGYATSDRNSKTSYLPGCDSSRYNAFPILKGLPCAWRGENQARADAGFVSEFPNAPWNPVANQIMVDELAWKMKFGSWQTYWYKDTPMYKNMMKPVLYHSDEEMAEAQAVLKYGSTMAKVYTAKN